MTSRTQFIKGCIAALLLSAIVSLSGLHKPLDQWGQAKFAAYLMHRIDSKITIVEIDAKSIDALGVWPWPRDVHAKAVEQLATTKPRSLFIDIDFSADSDPLQDQRLSQTLNTFADNYPLYLPVFQQRLSIGDRQKVIRKPDNLSVAQAQYVSVNLLPEKDGVVSQAPYGFIYGQEPYPLAASAVAEKTPEPTLIDFSIDPASFRYVSFIDLYEGRVSPAVFSNRKVMLGATALELGDNVPVPVHRSLPGVVVQALIAETLSVGSLKPIAATHFAAIMIAWIALSGLLIARLNWKTSFLALVALGCVWTFFAAASSYIARWQMPIALPWISLAIVYLIHVLQSLNANLFEKIDLQFRLRSRESLMTSVFKTSNDCILCIDNDGFIREMSSSGEKLTGYHRDDYPGIHIRALLPSLDWRERAQEQPFDTMLRTQSGENIPIELCITPVTVVSSLSHTMIMRDIRQRIARENALKHQATHDDLTGLPNRAYLIDSLNACAKSDHTGTLCMIDLALFKQINDHYGHALGDQLLQNVAQRLKNLSEKYDDSTQQQVFRLGSDEFAYLCSPQLEEQYSVALAKQLIDTLSMPYDVEHAQVEISACIGITQIRNGNDDATQIIKRADLALQRAKQSSEPIALYAEDMDEALNRQIALAPLLRQAIKCDELHLAFQPKICSHDHSVHGFEVLCRWNDHNGQAIPADWFITTAENSRLIKPLTEWVIKRLLSIESEWQRRQMPRNLAFNLSARLLDNTALIRKLCEKLRASQGYCEFEFEITESSLMTNPKRALASINAIRQAGFAISIDDYGTGYSSLAYLCDLDASALKIDRSFITNCHSNETNRIIVSSTVRMAHELGLRTVAEGIETAEEEKLLHSLGCDYLQGYRYSKPLVLDEIIPWFEKWQLQQHANIKRVEDYRPNKQG